ncbi:MAG: Ig-like domain-containing protein, partial [Muribaculaceae bacterium]|nr:Ig-like domain-containing protein [Muribaculaceae bacterium]
VMIFFMTKAATVDITFADIMSNGDKPTSIETGDPNLSIKFAKGTGSNDPQYYSNGSAFRIYSKNTITVTVPVGYKLNDITFTASGTGYVVKGSVNNGSLKTSGTVTSWSGEAEQIVVTISATCRMTQMQVTYDALQVDNFTSLTSLLAKIRDVEMVNVETPMSVIYQSGNYHMVTDGKRNMLLFGPSDDEAPVGTNLTKVSGAVTLHESHYELTSVELTEGGEGATIAAKEINSLNDVNHQDNIYDLIQLNGCSISGFDGTYATITYKGETVKLHNAFDYEDVSYFNGREGLTLTGFIIRWDNVMNIIPIKIVGTAIDYVLPTKEMNIPAGETFNITFGNRYPSKFRFESSNESVVTVDENGAVTGVAPGNATITVKWDGDDNFKEGQATIKVVVTDALLQAVLCHTNREYNGDIAAESVTKSNTDPSYIVDVMTLTHSNGSFDQDFRFGASSTFTIKPAQNITINKIVFTNKNTSGSPEVTVNTGVLTSEDKEYTWRGSSEEPIVFTTTAMLHVYYFEVYYTLEPVDETKTPVVMSWNESAVEGTIGEEFIAPVLTLDNEDARSAVRYMSENVDAAKIDEITGKVTLVGDGTTLIRAYIPEDNATYAASRTSYLLTVIDNTKTTIDVNFLGNKETTYDLVTVTDNMGVVYQSVYSANTNGSIQFNPGNKNGGAASALIVKDNTRNGHIIESVTVSFQSAGKGVTIYAQDKNFESLVKGQTPDLGDAAVVKTITENGRVEIGKAAFAIVPVDGSVQINSINVQYSDKRVCMLSEEELTPNYGSKVELAADGTGVMKFDVNKNHGITIHYKHEAAASTPGIIGALVHEGFTQAVINEGDGETDSHEITVPSAGRVTYYGYHTATGTKGVERVAVADVPTGVEGVAADAENGEAEYFNLNGVKVDADNLVPGLYIRRSGSKAEKVVVK